MDNNVTPEKKGKKGPSPFMVGIGIFILFGVLVLSTLDFRGIFARTEAQRPQETTSSVSPMSTESEARARMSLQSAFGSSKTEAGVPAQSTILVPRGDYKPKPNSGNIGSMWYDENSNAQAQMRKEAAGQATSN
ncbi:MAG TPA: hypothetical protein PLB31_01585 [Fimbriimonadaceae bacterium]|nr:hypothetical protein [Armatimonadota bacterium]HCM73437.1 hypothetical protein [Armatimonadota bacterium]HRD30793.1 hypothetical protein [Fimbriimonadaceae bacterium]HRE94764.1 hypothetical protein [Fimbriimonadaceae bacterium]HRI73145.1 hypothetical protein [Fimbriimonadaceae bacterium]